MHLYNVSAQSLLSNGTARTYQRSLRILRANPTAKARQELSEALESLRKLGDRK